MRKIILFVSVLVLGLQFESLSAAIYHEIDTTIPLKCTFSRYHQNRIAVDGGRITKIIFTGDSIAVRMEEESGQAFVKEIYPRELETILSVITDKGVVQDIEVTFEEKSSEVVILREANEAKNKTDSRTQDMGLVIDQILSGTNPKGFTCVDNSNDYKVIKKWIRMYGVARFESKDEIISLYRLKNCRKKAITICENELSSERTDWIYLVKNILLPQEETIVLITVRRW